MKKLVLFFVVMISVFSFSINFHNPLGPTLLPAAQMFIERPDNINLNYWRTLDEAQVLMIREQTDAIVLPVAFGINMIEKGVKYQLAGVSLWKTFFLVSSIELETLEDLSGKRILTLHGPGQTADLVLKMLKNEKDLNFEIIYLSAAAEIVQLLASNKENIAVLPEPFVSLAGVRTQGKVRTYFDMQEVYADLTGLSPSMPISGLFLRSTLNENDKKYFIKLYENSANFYFNNYFDSAVNFVFNAMGGNMPEAVLKMAANNSEIYFKHDKEIIVEYLNILKEYDLINNYDDSFFY